MINIIPCDIGQIDILTDIAIKTYTQNYLHLWLDEGKYYIEKVYNKETLEADLAKPGTSYFLVYNDNEVIGYFKLRENAYSSFSPQSCLEIDKLYLLQQAKGTGVGKTIMNRIFSIAKSQNRAIIWLMVMESSPAKKIYENFGFRQTDRSYLDYPNMVDDYRWILTMVADSGI